MLKHIYNLWFKSYAGQIFDFLNAHGIYVYNKLCSKSPVVGKSVKAPRNRHLSSHYSASTSTRLAFSPENSNCERQSQENTRRKFPAASLLEHITGISMCHQHQRPHHRRSNSYLSVTPTPFPTYRPQSRDGSPRTSFRKQN